MNSLQSALVIQIGLAAVTFLMLFYLVAKDSYLKKDIEKETEKAKSTSSDS